MALHNQIGQQGESLARKFLEDKGYEILDKNWCFKKAEVDLIAYYQEQLIFIEVKTRTSRGFGEPEDFVHDAKQTLLQQAAEEYIHIMDFQGEIRFDIISVLFNGTEDYTIKHIEDAFW
jgi:putative endonuclease